MPDVGRWMQLDPLVEDTEDPYAYVFNNPISLFDPDGRAPDDIRILGANGSSVTIKTDLVDVTVNASPLGVDFGGNYTLEGREVVKTGLDLVGYFDPSPISDGLSAKMSFEDGDYVGGIISTLAAAPIVVGDVIKTPKVLKGLDKINDAIKATDKAKDAKKATGSYTITFESGKKYHGKGSETRMNKSASDKAKANNDAVKSKNWTSAKNNREAFKQESRRMHTDKGGHKSKNNYNKRASPGDKYRKQDGD